MHRLPPSRQIESYRSRDDVMRPCNHSSGSILSKDEFHISLNPFEGFNEQMAILLRGKSAKKQNVFVRLQTPLLEAYTRGPPAQHCAVRYVGGLNSMCKPVMLLKLL